MFIFVEAGFWFSTGHIYCIFLTELALLANTKVVTKKYGENVHSEVIWLLWPLWIYRRPGSATKVATLSSLGCSSVCPLSVPSQSRALWSLLYCSTLHCNILQCTTLHCTALHFCEIQCTAPQCNSPLVPFCEDRQGSGPGRCRGRRRGQGDRRQGQGQI